MKENKVVKIDVKESSACALTKSNGKFLKMNLIFI